jgi:hypothetical protein
MFGILIHKNVYIYFNKVISTLKGHTTSINALSIFPSESDKHILLSGSYDTNVKSNYANILKDILKK